MEELTSHFTTVTALSLAVTTMVQFLKEVLNLKNIVIRKIFGRPLTVSFLMTVIFCFVVSAVGTIYQLGIFAGLGLSEAVLTGCYLLITSLGLFDVAFRRR